VTLDRGRDPEHDRLVDPVAAGIQIEFGVLELLDDQGLESVVHCRPRWWSRANLHCEMLLPRRTHAVFCEDRKATGYMFLPSIALASIA